MALGDGKTLEVEVGDHDTVDQLIAAVREKEGFFPSDQMLLYRGKQLDPGAELQSYLIRDGTVIALPATRAQKAKLSPTGFSRRPLERAEKLSSGSSRTDGELRFEQGFDDDEHLLDPSSYYNRLDTLERSVIEASEFYQVDGSYEPMISYINLEEKFTSLDRDPQVWERIRRVADFRIAVKLDKDTAINFGMSLGKSYLILCRVLDSLRNIRHNGFCEDSFTILIHQETTEGNVAELVVVDRWEIDKFLAAIGGTIRRVVDVSHNVSDMGMLTSSDFCDSGRHPVCLRAAPATLWNPYQTASDTSTGTRHLDSL